MQDPRVVDVFTRITNIRAIEPDEDLYAGGISMMIEAHFQNPHIDNLHDRNRQCYRLVNLLYYAFPDWKLENGGNLEPWPGVVAPPQVTIERRFNRRVVMITSSQSWHSVSPVRVAEPCCCVSNYYFSQFPAESHEYYHVTSYRGRPEQKLRDFILRADNALTTGIMKSPLRHVIKNPHFYATKD